MKNVIVAFISMILVFKIMHWQGEPLKTSVTPNGILALEFANNFEKVHPILNTWNPNTARINILIDFVFLISYSLFFIFSIQYISKKSKKESQKNAAIVILKIALLPGLFDAIENILMLQTLSRNSTEILLQITYYCVIIKFTLAALIVLFILVRLPITLLNRKK